MKPTFLLFLALTSFGAACESKTKTPTPPPVPDIPMPKETDMGASASSDMDTVAQVGDQPGTTEADGGTKVEIKDPKSPIAVNLVNFVPQVLDGVRARRVEAVKTAPIAYGFYQGAKRKVYNVHITGPSQTEKQRRAQYPLLGKDEKEDNGVVFRQGFKIEQWDGEETFDKKKEKSEAVVLVNPFVEVKVSVAPGRKGDARKLLEEIDLKGVSQLR